MMLYIVLLSIICTILLHVHKVKTATVGFVHSIVSNKYMKEMSKRNLFKLSWIHLLKSLPISVTLRIQILFLEN